VGRHLDKKKRYAHVLYLFRQAKENAVVFVLEIERREKIEAADLPTNSNSQHTLITSKLYLLITPNLIFYCYCSY